MHTNAVSIKELSKQNSAKFNKRGLNCILHMVDFEKKTNDIRYVFLLECLEPSSNKSGHIVTLKFDKNTAREGLKSRPYNDDCHVHCQCPSFTYWGPAYNATQNDYNLDFSENRAPDERDPLREVKICKHLSRVARMLSKVSYNGLDKKAGIVAALSKTLDQDIDLIPVEETFPSLMGYLERNHKDINPRLFCANLNRDTFEDELLSIGAII